MQVTIPSLTEEPTNISALPKLPDSVAQSIFDAGTKIIYSNVVVPTDIYLMREAMRYVPDYRGCEIITPYRNRLVVRLSFFLLRLGFAPVNGYVWILNTLSQSGYPQANERGGCATAVSICACVCVQVCECTHKPCTCVCVCVCGLTPMAGPHMHHGLQLHHHHHQWCEC